MESFIDLKSSFRTTVKGACPYLIGLLGTNPLVSVSALWLNAANINWRFHAVQHKNLLGKIQANAFKERKTNTDVTSGLV